MTFLEAIAKDIIEKYGRDLSRTVVVFPNKRASLFLNEYLVKTLAEKSKEATPDSSAFCSSAKALTPNSSHITPDCLWAPQYITISDLFRSQSSLIVADHIKLVVELYKVYVEITGRKNETLDEFYSWGELLLSDFDDLDKNEADPVKVFQNTADLHSFDTDEFLSEEQKEVLKRFFTNFTDNHDSELKKRFAELWNRLGDIYQKYHEVLREQGIAYEGMLYRDVVEKSQLSTLNSPLSTLNSQLSTLHSQPSTLNSQLNAERYIFIGFNLLQKVEQDLFSLLIKEHGNVKFYWDYDEYYCNSLPVGKDEGRNYTHEAGQYIKQYLPSLPNELPSGELFQNFEKPKDISYISASTEDMQARYVSEWLTPERIAAGKRTAIVLCNENLLPTVINCLPNEVEHVNITSGYPLAKTQIYTLIRQYLSLHLMGKNRKGDRFRLHIVNNVLRHPYMQYISPRYLEVSSKLNDEHIFFPTLEDISAGDENLKMFFSPIEQNNNISLCERLMWITKTIAVEMEKQHKANVSKQGNLVGAYDGAKEALFRIYTLLNRLHSLIENDGLNVDAMTFQRLLMQIVKTTTVPFHGEPIIGIQIMGVLETRNLDFDHVLLLSCNEGNMPKGVNDSSFIPHAIRKGYGLTTVDNKVAIYAYYFHRLLQRASDVEITYNSSTEDGQTGEKSRFMIQLQAESKLNIKLKSFSSDITPATSQTAQVEKDDTIMNALLNIEKLSPSDLNSYLRCPKAFYYKVLCGLKDEDDEDEAEFDNRHFGNVFHKTMELIYRPLLNQNLTESIISSLIKDKRKVEDALDMAIMIEVFKFDERAGIDLQKMPQLNGNQLIIRRVIRRLVLKTLEYDKKHTPIIIRGVEKGFGTPVSFESNGEQRTIKITGYIDRIDELQGTDGAPITRIVDYKTGSRTPSISAVEEIFDPTKVEKHSDYYLQTMLYSIVTSAKIGKRVAPALLYPSKVHSDGYNPILTFGTSRSKEQILDSAEYQKEFSNLLKALLSDIFNKDKPFAPTEITKRCENCFFANLCR